MNISANYEPVDAELKNKIILVTGANRGFGLAITKDLAQAGATVIMIGRDLGSLEHSYDFVVEAGAQEPILYPFDLEGAIPEQYQELQDRIETRFGILDGLIHNAAILGTMMPIEQYDIKLWYSAIQINLNAPFMLTQFLIPLLKKANDARVLFISAEQGREAKAYWGAYGVSKFAIEGFAKILSEELENSNIKINTLDPGKMQTELRRTAYPAENSSINPPPEDKSVAIVGLMGLSGKEIQGQTLTFKD